MSVATAIQAYLDATPVIVRRGLADGTAVVLESRDGGKAFGIIHLKDGGRHPVAETPYPDEAQSIFEAFDGVDRGWHRAYLPRGGAFHDSDAMTTKVVAVGHTVEDCARAAMDARGETLREGSISDEGDGWGSDTQFFVRFVSEPSGTGFKASGRKVPGGYVITWLS